MVVVCSGVSSFNQLIHELSVDSDVDDGSSIDYEEEYSDDDMSPASPSSHSSRFSRSASIPRQHWTGWMWISYIFYWILFPARFLLGLPILLFRSGGMTPSAAPASNQPHPQRSSSLNKVQFLKDHIFQRTTDRRRGVIEV